MVPIKRVLYLSTLLSCMLFAQDDVEQLKKQVQIQQKMITELTKRLDRLEDAQSGNGYVENKKAPSFEDSMAQNTQVSSSFSQNAYLPDIALIINSSMLARNIDNIDYKNYEIPGFVDTGTADIPFNPDRGFNMNYDEIAMYSAVDPYFDAFAIFHMRSNEFEIDEAYVVTRDLPNGLKVKAGRFKSAIGRYNEKHQHAWKFSTQPLIYSALFGPEGVDDPGIQLQWIAPTDTYLMFGLEAMQGTNTQSFGYEKSNTLYNAYVKSSIDINDETSVLAGASYLHGKNPQGNTDIYGADLTIQKELTSYSNISWQSEYFYRAKQEQTQDKKQGGFYSQLVYKYNQNYAYGVRYDDLIKNDVADNLDSYTAMMEYKFFEFSRLRLEYTLDRSKYFDGKQKDVKQLMLELNIAVGAHGAHSY